VSGKGTLKNFKAMLAEAKLPEATVLVCMRGDLVADHEAAERELEQARKTAGNSLAGNGAAEIAERITALEEEMREHSYEFRLRALPRHAWRELLKAHEPRRDESGDLVEADRHLGFNAETFYDDMVRHCLIDPELTDEEFARLADRLTSYQFDELFDAAWGLNRRDVDIPFSRAASEMRRASAAE
jgi:hypothetical protein